MNPYRAVALALALAGVLFAAYVEYGTPRAADVERTFGWFAYGAGPFVLTAVLAAFTPYGRALSLVAVALLALEAYAYWSVFGRTPVEGAALVYLYKPLYGVAIVAGGMLAGFLVARARGYPG